MIVSSVLVAGVLALAWYLLVERVAVEQRARAAELARTIEVGDQVITGDGMVVVVEHVEGDRIVARLLSGAQVAIDVGSVLERTAARGAQAHRTGSDAAGVSALDREFAATTSKWFGAAGGVPSRIAPT